MKIQTVGIIGQGFVGGALASAFSNHYKVYTYDKILTDLSTHKSVFSLSRACELLFVCVPTPMREDGSCDISIVKEVVQEACSTGRQNIIAIKSTIPPNTTKLLQGLCQDSQIVFNPEFLRESTTPNEDFENQHTVVIGTDDLNIFKEVKKMYQQVLHSEPKYYHTSTTEAEMIKCAQNTMLASRVALANIIFDACDEHEVDYSKVREIAFDRFEILGPHMVQVPGPDGKRGFGGKCLPKDIHAFSSVHNSELLSMIIKYNNSLRNDLD